MSRKRVQHGPKHQGFHRYDDFDDEEFVRRYEHLEDDTDPDEEPDEYDDEYDDDEGEDRYDDEDEGGYDHGDRPWRSRGRGGHGRYRDDYDPDEDAFDD